MCELFKSINVQFHLSPTVAVLFTMFKMYIMIQSRHFHLYILLSRKHHFLCVLSLSFWSVTDQPLSVQTFWNFSLYVQMWWYLSVNVNCCYLYKQVNYRDFNCCLSGQLLLIYLQVKLFEKKNKIVKNSFLRKTVFFCLFVTYVLDCTIIKKTLSQTAKTFNRFYFGKTLCLSREW